MKKVIMILWWMVVCFWAHAQSDTLSKNSGDPNDPDCPCYHVQQKAEKEYQAMQIQQRKQREDSLLKKHHKEKELVRKRMKQNQKRKKKKDCPELGMVILQEKRLNRKPFFSYNWVPVSV